jgi:hypothetical protein
MKAHGWQSKYLNVCELMPEPRLLNLFLTAPPSSSLSHDYSDFKTQNCQSRKQIIYKAVHPPVKSRKVVKYEGPRFNASLPSPEPLKILRSSISPKPLPKPRQSDAELQIEDMLRNRQTLTLPKISAPKEQYRSLNDRLIKSRSESQEASAQHCESLLQNIKRKIRTNSYNIEAEMNYWDKQPIRRWNLRNSRVIQQRFYKQTFTEEIGIDGLCNTEEYSALSAIDEILETCGNDIMNA